MPKELMLEVFTLGVKVGLKQAKLGFEPDKMSDEDAAQVLAQEFEQADAAIEAIVEKIKRRRLIDLWYAQHFTAKAAYEFGVHDGFNIHDQVEEHKGVRMLTPEVVAALSEKVFRQTQEAP